MLGLIYKDYVMIGGKKLAKIVCILTALYVLCCAFMALTGECSNFNYIGNRPNNPICTMLVVFQPILLVAIPFINRLTSNICSLEEKNLLRYYLCSTPIKRQDYIASKFLLIGGMVLVFLMIYQIWYWVCIRITLPGSGENHLLYVMNYASFLFSGILLLLAGAELPLFLLLGKEKAGLVKTSFLMLLALLLVALVLFGDLSHIEVFDTENVFEWIDQRSRSVKTSLLLLYVFALLLYGLSYLFTSRLYEKRDVRIDL